MINTNKEMQGKRKYKKKLPISNLDKNVKFKRLSSYCISREFSLSELTKYFGDRTFAVHNTVVGCKCVREFNDNLQSNLDLYKFVDPYDEGDNFDFCYIFWFEYGVVVFWNFTEIEEKSIISELKSFEIGSNFKIQYDFIIYDENKYEDEAFDPKSYIGRDQLKLCSKRFEEKLAVSYSIAQSAKLDYFEVDIDYSNDETRSLAEELAKNGYINIDHITLNKKIGKLYLKKNEINLDTDILDIPDYFWNNDKYQPNFNVVCKYFEISKRTEVINHRLNIIGELLYVLNEEVNFNHISNLDWTIIILILINVLILFFWDILFIDILGNKFE